MKLISSNYVQLISFINSYEDSLNIVKLILSHHFVMWLAAQMADPKRSTPFKDYAILGDDVAVNYRWLLDKLGVSISDSKSIVSKTGCIEFAKKFRVKAMQVDLSPVPSCV